MKYERKSFIKKIDEIINFLRKECKYKKVKVSYDKMSECFPGGNIESFCSKLESHKDFRLSMSSSIFSFSELSENDSEITILSMWLREFDACCGKILGHRMFLRNIPELTEEQHTDLAMKYFEAICYDCVLRNYTSLGFISSPENHLLNKILIEKSGFKIINQFENKRMSNKNLCTEFEIPLQ